MKKIAHRKSLLKRRLRHKNQKREHIPKSTSEKHSPFESILTAIMVIILIGGCSINSWYQNKGYIKDEDTRQAALIKEAEEYNAFLKDEEHFIDKIFTGIPVQERLNSQFDYVACAGALPYQIKYQMLSLLKKMGS